jgi:L-cysteine S-thiosulfotransferase
VRLLHHGLVAGLICLASTLAAATDRQVAKFEQTGDAILAPLDGLIGDAARGRALVLNRETGNCLICHQVPVPAEPFQGDLAPSLAGVGARLNAGQIRLRLVDQGRLNPATLMPAYHRIDGLTRVAPRYRNLPVLSAQESEDVVAWIATLKD